MLKVESIKSTEMVVEDGAKETVIFHPYCQK